MIKPFNSTTVIALCAGVTLIGFAFDQRGEHHVNLPAVAYYIAAAVICLLPVFAALVRHKTCARSQRADLS